jgi:hypothetical protein
MHQLQHPPPPAINFPLALLVQQLSLHLVVTSFMPPSYPWPPPKRLASNQQYSRPGYADLIIQRKPIARTRINAGSWGDGVAQHIKGGEIGLGVWRESIVAAIVLEIAVIVGVVCIWRVWRRLSGVRRI